MEASLSIIKDSLQAFVKTQIRDNPVFQLGPADTESRSRRVQSLSRGRFYLTEFELS